MENVWLGEQAMRPDIHMAEGAADSEGHQSLEQGEKEQREFHINETGCSS